MQSWSRLFWFAKLLCLVMAAIVPGAGESGYMLQKKSPTSFGKGKIGGYLLTALFIPLGSRQG